MWSGPRNISTAMLRAWGNRDDTFVCDEPLYANYLLEHGLDHPGRDEILAHHDSDLERVVHWLTEDTSFDRAVFYQKHMAHHLLPETDRSWVAKLTNVFLIRDPAEMLTSLIHILPEPKLPDTGLPQQRELFDLERERLGRAPAVIDSADVLRNPRAGLDCLCRAVGADFDEAMLNWPPGRRETDGHLGAALVRCGREEHRLRAVPSQERAGSGVPCRCARGVPGALRSPGRAPPALLSRPQPPANPSCSRTPTPGTGTC